MASIIRFFGAALQAVLWVVLLGFLLLAALPRFTSLDVLVVRGGSMEPAIHVGALLVIDRDSRSPAVGDIASFTQPDGSIVTHRVSAIDAGVYTTTGDANPGPDLTPRLPGDVLGTSVLSVPYLGFGVHVLRQPPMFIALLAGTGGFLIVAELRNIAREIGRMRRKPEASA
jgi:signal peptidase